MRIVAQTLIAADGWKLKYDVEARPASIEVWDGQGVPQASASGEITQNIVDRWVAWFTRDHDTEMQGRLEGL